MTFTRQLQDLIHAWPSRAELARASGVSEAVLSRFVSGERAMTTRNLDRLSAVMGLRVVADKKPPKPKGR